MEGDLTEEIKVALSEEERLARAVTKSSRRGSWWTRLICLTCCCSEPSRDDNK